VRRQVISDAITRLEERPTARSPTEFSDAFAAVEDLAFYLSQEQCDQVNALTQAEHERRLANEEFALFWPRVAPHPDMDDSYFRA
jgi:hypothetical protein